MPSAAGVISNAGVGEAIGNMFTGNLDFQRQDYFFNKQIAANNAQAVADRQFTARQNELTRAFNAAEAEKARAFQEEQSKTQYLRAADQLKQLGINPAVLFIFKTMLPNNFVKVDALGTFTTTNFKRFKNFSSLRIHKHLIRNFTSTNKRISITFIRYINRNYFLGIQTH